MLPIKKGRGEYVRREKSNPDIEFLHRIGMKIEEVKTEDFMRRIITKLTITPEISNLWFTLGELLSQAKLYEEANEAFERVVRLNPDNQKLWNSKAYVLRKLGKQDQASDCYQKSLESFTGQLDGYNDLLDLVNEIKERRKELGLGEFDDESIEYLTKNILDLDSFISELERLSEIDVNKSGISYSDNLTFSSGEQEDINKNT